MFLGSIGIKITKKLLLFTKKTVKNRPLPEYLPRQLLWGECIKSAISHVCCTYAHIFDTESYNARAYIFDAEDKTLRGNGTNMIGLSFTGMGGFNGRKRGGEADSGDICVNK